MTAAASLRAFRRRTVKRYGKKLIFGLDRFVARQSLVGDLPVYDPARFAWAGLLESHWQDIRGEAEKVLESREHIPAMHEVSPDQYRISTGKNWQSFFLYGFGETVDGNVRRCPKTAAVLEQIPHLRTAFFSILAPDYHILPHRGVTKSVIRGHLGLMVPDDRDKCRIRVGPETLHWDAGKCITFDDTYEHEVWNETDQERVVLIVDVDRPMRLAGRMASSAMLWAFRWSAYVRDAKKNLTNWDARLESAARQVDGYSVEADGKG